MTHPAQFGRWILATALAAGFYVMLADYLNLRAAAGAETPRAIAGLPLAQPWGGYGWRALSRLAGDASVQDPEIAAETLRHAAVRYPLDATQWLDLAQIHVAAGRGPEAEVALAKARATQPLDRRSLWRAAQIALRTGDDALAERHLRQWLRLYPGDTGQALFIGRRWIDAPGELIDRMLPPGRAFLEEAMRVAVRRRDPALAEAVWDRLEPKPGLDDAEFQLFTDLLLAIGEVDRAVELWASRDPAFDGRGIVNGQFTRPPGRSAGLDWHTANAPAAVRIEHDTRHAWSQPASLRIEFNGKENIYLAQPTIRIPVQPGRLYRLAGMWRAEALTTRSLPYFELRTPHGPRWTIRVPVADFPWEDWELTFRAPSDTRLVQLSLRRDRTDAFDRNIDGTLWVDDIVLEPLPEQPAMEATADD